jgi:hypothetical protein
MTKTLALTTLSVLTLALAPAMAGTQDDIAACEAEMAAELANRYPTADVRFAGARGATVKTITFEVRDETGARKVVCKVKRGEVRSIDWPRT